MILKHFVAALLLSCTVSTVACAEDEFTEIIVVGTAHFITDMPEGYTPAHLRVLLEKISPAALMVEAPSNVAQPWDFAPFELSNVTRPWAQAHAIPVIPVGWQDQWYQAKLGAMMQVLNVKDGAAYGKIEAAFQNSMASQPQTCEFMNSVASQKLWRDYHAALHKIFADTTPWESWNEKIAGNVLKVAKEYRGKRIAFVFGAAHLYYAIDRLSKEPGIRIQSAASFFPLPDAQIKTQTSSHDYLLSLRPLNFGSNDPTVLGRMDAALNDVQKDSRLDGDYHLFRGKYYLNCQKFAEALAQFQTLANLTQDPLSEFDGQSHLKEAGKIYASITKIRMGQTDKARQELNEILENKETTSSSREWVQQLLNSIPK